MPEPNPPLILVSTRYEQTSYNSERLFYFCYEIEPDDNQPCDRHT